MSLTSGRTVGHQWQPWLVGLAVVGSVLLPACGGSDGDTAAAEGSGGNHTSNTEPSADDPEAVRPFVEDLLERYSEVTGDIVADPGVAADHDDLVVQEYLSLFEPGSDYAEERLASWEANGEAGVSMRPISDDQPASVSHLDGDIEVVSDDEVRFPTCDEQRYEVLDAEGRVTQRTELFLQPGEGAAVRVDGEWRLRRMDLFEETAGCQTDWANQDDDEATQDETSESEGD